MTGKRFEPPRPHWNILRRLGHLAQMPSHESDGVSIRTGEPLPAERIHSPVAAFSGPLDYCIGKAVASPARPVSVRLDPAPIEVSGADSGEEEIQP